MKRSKHFECTENREKTYSVNLCVFSVILCETNWEKEEEATRFPSHRFLFRLP